MAKEEKNEKSLSSDQEAIALTAEEKLETMMGVLPNVADKNVALEPLDKRIAGKENKKFDEPEGEPKEVGKSHGSDIEVVETNPSTMKESDSGIRYDVGDSFTFLKNDENPIIRFLVGSSFKTPFDRWKLNKGDKVTITEVEPSLKQYKIDTTQVQFPPQYSEKQPELNNQEAYMSASDLNRWVDTNRATITESVGLLDQKHLSSAEYQKAKKLKKFNKDDYKFDGDQQLYTRKKPLMKEEKQPIEEVLGLMEKVHAILPQISQALGQQFYLSGIPITFTREGAIFSGIYLFGDKYHLMAEFVDGELTSVSKYAYEISEQAEFTVDFEKPTLAENLMDLKTALDGTSPQMNESKIKESGTLTEKINKALKEAKSDDVKEFLANADMTKPVSGLYRDYFRWSDEAGKANASEAYFRNVVKSLGQQNQANVNVPQSDGVGPKVSHYQDTFETPVEYDEFEEEIMKNDVFYKYEMMGEIVKKIVQKDKLYKNVFIYGVGGIGKTYTVEEVIKKYGHKEDVVTYKGAIAGFTGLLQVLWENRDGKIIVFDDNDGILSGGQQNAANLLKGAMEMSDPRILAYSRFKRRAKESTKIKEEMTVLSRAISYFYELESTGISQEEGLRKAADKFGVTVQDIAENSDPYDEEEFDPYGDDINSISRSTGDVTHEELNLPSDLSEVEKQYINSGLASGDLDPEDVEYIFNDPEVRGEMAGSFTESIQESPMDTDDPSDQLNSDFNDDVMSGVMDADVDDFGEEYDNFVKYDYAESKALITLNSILGTPLHEATDLEAMADEDEFDNFETEAMEMQKQGEFNKEEFAKTYKGELDPEVDPAFGLGPEDEIPDQFQFNSRVIFISNLMKIPQALFDRTYAVGLLLTKEQILDLIDSKMGNLMRDVPEITLDDKKEVLKFMRKYLHRAGKIPTFRGFQQLAALYKSDHPDHMKLMYLAYIAGGEMNAQLGK